MSFEENWDSYIDETISLLNDQSDADFSPRLDLLDQMMASFEIKHQVGSGGIIHNRQPQLKGSP